MRILIIYFTMGGRTKKMAEIIGDTLKNHEVTLYPLEIKAKLKEKIKIVEDFNNNDFSLVEKQLKKFNLTEYDLFIIGMPTYGGFPPKLYEEILERMGDINEKQIVLFNTAAFMGRKALNYMKEKIEEKSANIIAQRMFKGLFRLDEKEAINFAKNLDL